MSQILIQQYLNQLQDLRKVSGTHRESVVREAFKDLLKAWARSHNLIFVAEYEIATPSRERRYVDGALVHPLRMPFGYWEAKDEKDDLDKEIEYKFSRGYPRDNIIFEDSAQAVLIQHKQEVVRCEVTDGVALARLLTLFFAHERAEITEFRRGVAQFKTDLPAILGALRDMIDKAYRDNAVFRDEAKRFLKHAQEAINPSVTDADVREMLIQHILTEEIFSRVFDESDFHRQNNVASELFKLEATFFTGDLKKRTLRGLDTYYSAIRAAAAQIGSHQEKQTFLKVIYENFYKVYNKKAADRLGVVYTPNELVRFMIESADWLCEKHFGRNLIDRDVDILDPAAGTGTFICELMEHFRGQPVKLKHKYLEELHANEVAILPYYVANLNIEATYAAITGEYLEFENLCFVDTLDNVGLHTARSGSTGDLFGSVSEENVARIKRQNSKRISVIIGNPPYNANQLNENENNKNREYPAIDKRIKHTYIAASTAQKTKLYDMYARFFRWASDRLDQNGVLAFVTNRSFISSRTFDGFRKVVEEEFHEIYVVDLGGDVRVNPKLSGTRHNVFGIQTGVTISFMVKRQNAQGCRIFYARRPELETAEEKLAFVGNSKLADLQADEIQPDANHNWLDLTQNDFDSFIPIASKETKASKSANQEQAVFKVFSNGINTARDDWVSDLTRKNLISKAKFFLGEYSALKSNTTDLPAVIKWSRNLKVKLKRGQKESFSDDQIVPYAYRPYFDVWLYRSRLMIDELGQMLTFDNKAPLIGTPATGEFRLLATNKLCDFHFIGDTRVYTAKRVDDRGAIVDNITDWALKQFCDHYRHPERSEGSAVATKSRKPRRDSSPLAQNDKTQTITKDAIFHYVYAVLHDPVYREKYALNLKREFPRIPFYAEFWRWADWGKTLMAMHIGYEQVEPWPLERIEQASAQPAPASGEEDFAAPRALLKVDKDTGRIRLDTQTSLAGVPVQAWDYRLGNRSALEWILDQYKEKTPRDPTIREKFNTYRFADYKEKVIELLMRVTRVSVETQKIVEAMRIMAH